MASGFVHIRVVAARAKTSNHRFERSPLRAGDDIAVRGHSWFPRGSRIVPHGEIGPPVDVQK